MIQHLKSISRNIFDRRMIYPFPKHFIIIKTSRIDLQRHAEIIAWVDKNLKGRYYVGSIVVREGRTIGSSKPQWTMPIYESILLVAFEDPQEATLYALSMDYFACLK